MSVLAIAIWSGHNYKVSTSILGAYGPDAPDGFRVRVLVDVEVMSYAGGSSRAILVVLTAKLLGLMEDATGSGAPITTAGSSHARDQVRVTESGVFWAKGRGVRVFSKDLVFTFTSRWRRRQGAWDRLLACLCRAGPGTPVFLVCLCRLRCGELLSRGDGGPGGGALAVALEPLLHVPDALLEGLEFGGLGLDILLSMRDARELLVALFPLFCWMVDRVASVGARVGARKERGGRGEGVRRGWRSG